MANGGNPTGGGRLRSVGGGGRIRSIGGGGGGTRASLISRGGKLAVAQSLNGESDNDLDHADQLLQGQVEKPVSPQGDFYFFFSGRYESCNIEPAAQGGCNSCWAFASVGAISSRLCKVIRDIGFEGFKQSPSFKRLLRAADNDNTVDYALRASSGSWGTPMLKETGHNSHGGLSAQNPLSCGDGGNCNDGGFPANIYKWV